MKKKIFQKKRVSQKGYSVLLRKRRTFPAPPKATVAQGASACVRRPFFKAKWFRAAALVLGSLLSLTLLMYLAGCLFFSGHFYPNTTIGTLDVSWMSQGRAAETLSHEAARYQIKVEGEGLSFVLAGDDIGLALDEGKTITAALNDKNVWRWPLHLRDTHEATKHLVATYDKDAILKAAQDHVQTVNATAVQPINATIAFDTNSSVFEVMPERLGTALDHGSVAQTLEGALVTLGPVARITKNDLLRPVITAKDTRLDEACASANVMIKTDLTLKLGDAQVAQLDPQRIAKWVRLNDDVTVSFDEDAFDAWVEGIAKGCNTVGTKRTYTTPEGKTVTVSGGSYGWEIDSKAFRKSIRKAMNAGKTGEFAIPVIQEGTGFEGIGARDWGKRYCDIDLSKQHAWYYDDTGACIWDSPIVSGKPNGNGTPTGVYKINVGKSSPATLVGQPLPGETKPAYITKVSYWMPFVRNSIGLHDATWQASFGGNRYSTGHGSHGCVNLPLSKARALYGLISVEDPVIVHY